jgi:hypothetical protein
MAAMVVSWLAGVDVDRHPAHGIGGHMGFDDGHDLPFCSGRSDEAAGGSAI